MPDTTDNDTIHDVIPSAMPIIKGFDLTPLNTLRLQSLAEHYLHVTHHTQLPQALEYASAKQLPIFVLGGGSNILLTELIPGLVIHMRTSGYQLLDESDNHVLVRVSAGQHWDDFLHICLQQGWYGLENLAIIPGTVGAAPIQNIGAYGQEVSSCIDAVQGFDIVTGKTVSLNNKACLFSYRDSIFKQDLLGKLLISSVDFRLYKTYQPCIDYAPLKAFFAQKEVTAAVVRQAVISIRRAKLPDPEVLANAGSFFKNPVIPFQQYEQLLQRFPNMPSFSVGKDKQLQEVKLAAAWLIEAAGWKGKRVGNLSMYEKQALVLVNYQPANYSEIEALALDIQASVKQLFDVDLVQEPSTIDFS